jgi:hypothetical protein
MSNFKSILHRLLRKFCAVSIIIINQFKILARARSCVISKDVSILAINNLHRQPLHQGTCSLRRHKEA